MHLAYETTESSKFSKYLIALASDIGTAGTCLRVHGEAEMDALPRLVLFSAAKRLLGDGMRLLGMKPMDKM